MLVQNKKYINPLSYRVMRDDVYVVVLGLKPGIRLEEGKG